MNPAVSSPAHALRELALLFLRLGVTAFGGPAAHIALMEHEIVRRRGWLSREDFLDLLGATNLIPGPNSTELAIHIGHRRAGWAGLLVAGACFILPAALIVAALAWIYVHFGRLPAIAAALYGVKPVIVGVVVQALCGLGKSALKSVPIGAIGVVAFGLGLLGMHEVLVLAVAGVLAALSHVLRTRAGGASAALIPSAFALPAAATTTTTAVVAAATPLGLFFVFVKIGSVLFGSGYVLLAFLRAELVTRLHWLTEAQLLDAVAVGQVTPGPVFTTATFVGHIVAGPSGAVAATVGIFLPAFVFVALSGPLVPRLRRSAVAGAVLDGVNIGSLALMALVAGQLFRSAVCDVPTAAIAVASTVVLLWRRPNSAWLVLGGAVFGFAVHALLA